MCIRDSFLCPQNNRVLSLSACHIRKSHMIPEEFLLYLGIDEIQVELNQVNNADVTTDCTLTLQFLSQKQFLCETMHYPDGKRSFSLLVPVFLC